MSKPKFARRRHILFKPTLIAQLLFSFFLRLLIFLSDFFEQVGYWLGFNRTVSANVSVSGVNVNFYVCNSGAVLTAIVLFLHKDVHLIDGIHWTVLFDVIGERLSEADH